MNDINLLITIPSGILIILVIYAVMIKVIKLEIYVSAGVLAILTVFSYGTLAVLAWPGADVFAIHLAIYLMTIYAMSIIARSLTGKTKWHWAPMLIIAFFMVVLLTDTLFIVLAQSGLSPQWAERLLPEPQSSREVQSRFPGTVSHDFREREGQFNEYRQQRALQTQRGWTVRIGWQENAQVGQHNNLIIEVRDEHGNEISYADVSGKMLFPGNMKLDQKFDMSYQGDGRYTKKLVMPHAGNWDFIIMIKKDQAQHELRTSTVVHETDKQ